MESLEIANQLSHDFPLEVLETGEFCRQVWLSVRRDRIVEICQYLRTQEALTMNYLVDLCGVDFPSRYHRFEIVYHLRSLKWRHQLRLKAHIPGDDPWIDSVVSVFQGANWFEREVQDMYGIYFEGHPDPRPLLMPEGWEGYPLRKDYPLRGPKDWEFEEFEEAKQAHEMDPDWTIPPR